MNHKFTKQMSLLLAGLLLLTALAGCADQDPKIETTVESTAETTTGTTTETTVGTTTETTETTVESQSASEEVTEHTSETEILLPGEYGDIISHADSLQNRITNRYTDSARTDFLIENDRMSLTYALSAEADKQIRALTDRNGDSYFENSFDVFVTMPDGTRFTASKSSEDAAVNIIRHGYYYNEIRIEGQNFINGLEILDEKIFNHRAVDLENNVAATVKEKNLHVEVTDPVDPWFSFDRIDFAAADFNYLSLTVKADKTVKSSAQIYLKAGASTVFTEAQSAKFTLIPDGEYHAYLIPLSPLAATSDFSGKVTGLRIDFEGEIGSAIEIKEVKAVNATDNGAPTVSIARTFHTYADKLHHVLQVTAWKEESNIKEIGMVTRIPCERVEALVIKDGNGLHTTLEAADGGNIEYIGVLIKGAGVFGYIMPADGKSGTLRVELSDGNYVLTQISALDGVLLPPDEEYINTRDFYMGQRLYTDSESDFDAFLEAAYCERNPLTAENFEIVGENRDKAVFEGYDFLRGTYVLSAKGIESFAVIYNSYPNKHIQTSFRVTADGHDRELYIMNHTGTGNLEAAVLLDQNMMMLPVPVEVCKNFSTDGDSNLYEYLEMGTGDAIFPLALKAEEDLEMTAVAFYQTWGRYPLKQVSSIDFFSPYYHFSTGVTETNCICFWEDERLPDFRAMSAPLWTSQPQHSRGGVHHFLQYTDSEGGSYLDYNIQNTVAVSGPTYAQVEMLNRSEDERIEVKYTHTELPQTDENRTFYRIEGKVLEDIDIVDFTRDFSFYSVSCRAGAYGKVGYLDASNTPQVKDALAVGSEAEMLLLGDQYPYFSYWKMISYDGTASDIGLDNYVNVACLVRSADFVIGGERYEGNLVLVDEGGRLKLTLELGEVTLKAGDSFTLELILLPWGSQSSESDENVRLVRENTLLDPFEIKAEADCAPVDDLYIPSVRSLDGKSATFSVTSGGDMNLTLCAYGFERLTAPVIYELIDGEWQIYEVSSAKAPGKCGNAYAYDGYAVHYDGDGSYSYSFVVTMEEGKERKFKVISSTPFEGWDPIEKVPEEEKPLDVYVDAAALAEAAKTGKDMGEIVLSEDGEYVTFYAKPSTKESFFTAYTNSDKPSGKYFVIKYRSAAALDNIEVYTSTLNLTGTAGDNFHIRASQNMLICDGEWHMAVVNVKNAVATFLYENGTYSAKYLRLDIFNGSFDASAAYIDVAFAGFTNDIDKILSLGSDLDAIMMLDGGRAFDLKTEGYEEESDTEDEDETETEPLIDREPIEDPVNVYLEPIEIKEASQTKYTKGFGRSMLTANGESIKFYADGSSAELILTAYMGGSEKSGKYAVIRYRIPTENAGKTERFEIFTSTVNEVPTAGDNFTVPVIHDGEWHTLVIDLSRTQSKNGFAAAADGSYTAKYFRVDLFNTVSSKTSYVELGYIAFCESMEQLSLIAEDYDSFPTEQANE